VPNVSANQNAAVVAQTRRCERSGKRWNVNGTSNSDDPNGKRHRENT